MNISPLLSRTAAVFLTVLCTVLAAQGPTIQPTFVQTASAQPQVPAALRPERSSQGFFTAASPGELDGIMSASPDRSVTSPTPWVPTSTPASLIPDKFDKALGAYDPGANLAALSVLSYDHYFVSWDMPTQWVPGLNQHQALLQDLAGSSRRGRQPIVTLEPWSMPALNSSSLLQDVVAGRYDDNIRWACTDLNTYKGEVIVRWGHEMEHVTGRYPWATNNTGAFVAAYRYFVDQCRSLAPNARFMWSPAGNRNLSGYWPGSNYVDYVGLSVYDYPDWEVSYYGYNRSFDENFSERYNYVKGYARPVMICEFGATGSTQSKWLEDALADMPNFPLLNAAVFFHAKDPAPWGALAAPDWRIDPGLLAPGQ